MEHSAGFTSFSPTEFTVSDFRRTYQVEYFWDLYCKMIIASDGCAESSLVCAVHDIRL